MLFASYISKYRTTLQRESATWLAPGQKNVHQPRYVAQFKAGVPDFVVDALRKKWPKMPVIHPSVGSPDGPVAWHSVCSLWDSKEAQRVYGWTDEQREQFEQKLMAHPRFGIRFIVVEKQKIPAPWATYDKLKVHGRRTIDHVVEEIIDIVQKTGVSPQAVISYEQENLNRPEIVTAMVGLTPPVEEDIELTAA